MTINCAGNSIYWSDFEWGGGAVNLTDWDRISVTITAGTDPNVVIFGLEAAQGIEWWKGIMLCNYKCDELGGVSTEGNYNRGPNWMTHPVNILAGSRIRFDKAKFFGVHTGMYELGDLTIQAGKIVRFTWELD